MTELSLGDQVIRFDREATVSAYTHLKQGDADRCTCSGCRNFALLRHKAYPGEFRELLEKLGIHWMKEGEAVHYGPKGNLHFYGGWFYFVGNVLEPGERLVIQSESFKYWFSTCFPKPPESFRSPVATIEFETDLPWILHTSWDPIADKKMMKAEDVIAVQQHSE